MADAVEVRDDRRVVIVASRFNEAVTRRLHEGALRTLETHGLAPGRVLTVWVDGAFELPVVAERAAARPDTLGVIALGAVIRGETPHFDFIARETARGLMQVALRHGVPVAFGVLTVDTFAQATARAGGDAGNKGEEAASAMLSAARAIDDVDR